MIAKTPKPPYYAVIFTSIRTEVDAGYAEMAERMEALAARQPGYLGLEAFRESSGAGTTISYWKTLEDLQSWKKNVEHREAQRLGRERWYRTYRLRVCRVEYEYGFG